MSSASELPFRSLAVGQGFTWGGDHYIKTGEILTCQCSSCGNRHMVANAWISRDMCDPPRRGSHGVIFNLDTEVTPDAK